MRPATSIVQQQHTDTLVKQAEVCLDVEAKRHEQEMECLREKGSRLEAVIALLRKFTSMTPYYPNSSVGGHVDTVARLCRVDWEDVMECMKGPVFLCFGTLGTHLHNDSCWVALQAGVAWRLCVSVVDSSGIHRSADMLNTACSSTVRPDRLTDWLQLEVLQATAAKVYVMYGRQTSVCELDVPSLPFKTKQVTKHVTLDGGGDGKLVATFTHEKRTNRVLFSQLQWEGGGVVQPMKIL